MVTLPAWYIREPLPLSGPSPGLAPRLAPRSAGHDAAAGVASMFGFSLSSTEPDSIAHIIQVALAPAFLLSALATC